MNLIDLHQRRDKRMVIGAGLTVVKTTWLKDTWRALLLPASDEPQLALHRLSRVTRLRGRPRDIGWWARSEAGGVAHVRLSDRDFDVERSFPLDARPAPLLTPWPEDGATLTDAGRLSLRYEGPEGASAEILVHRCLDRGKLMARARGRGIELGPGPAPQVMPSDDTSVIYIEETPAEEWARLYDKQNKYGAAKADFSAYVLGTADHLPVEDGTLDFIFSSHVFEHLANPLGHLRRWREKLKPGGCVMAVVPEMHSTKDCTGEASTLEEIDAEAAADIWTPQDRHYERFAVLRGRGVDADAMAAARESIHVHFYDLANIGALMARCVRDEGFSRYHIEHAPNHKDMHFLLWR